MIRRNNGEGIKQLNQLFNAERQGNRANLSDANNNKLALQGYIMETNDYERSILKKDAISILKSLEQTEGNNVSNIIETILKCYVDVDVVLENGIKVNQPTDQPSEVKYLIRELQSFLEGIKSDN